MSDQAALLLAIVDQPDDLTLRLIYADFLEEHGETTHATFIRAQCSIDSVIRTPEMNEFGYLVDYRLLPVESLEPNLAEILLQPIAAFLADTRATGNPEDPNRSSKAWVRRGFIEQITVFGAKSLAAFLDHVPAILAALPLRKIILAYDSEGNLNSLTADLAARFFAYPEIRKLQSLELPGMILESDTVEILLNLGPVHWERLLLNFTATSAREQAQLETCYRGILSQLDDDIPF